MEQVFTCACSGGGLNLDAGEGETISDLMGAANDVDPIAINNTGRCIAILGNLEVNVRLTITGGEVRMQPGSRITLVDRGELILNGVNENEGMHGCEEMWRGIEFDVLSAPAGAGLLIEMTNSKIQDAEFAVHLERNTTLNAAGCTFNRNYVGILAEGNLPNLIVNPVISVDLTGNTFSSTGPILQFKGDCGCNGLLCTQISGNELRQIAPPLGFLGTGLSLYDAITWNQDKQGNKWYDEENGAYGAIYSGNPLLLEFSEFIIQTDELPFYPERIAVTGGLESDWFSVDESLDFFECEDMLNEEAPETREDLFELVADSALAHAGYGAGAQWMASYALYQSLQRDPGLLTNTALDSFFTLHETTQIGQFAVIEQRLATLDQQPEELITVLDSLDEEIIIKIDSLKGLKEDIEIVYPSVPSYLVEDYEDVQEAIEADFAHIDSLENDWQDDRGNTIDSLIILNTAISASGDPATNKKVVLGILLEMLAADALEPDSLQRLDLEPIAAQCPAEGGDAIYQALVLLQEIRLHDDCIEEPEALARPVLPVVADQTDRVTFTLYPNPTKGSATLEIHTDLTGFNLQDATGRSVRTYHGLTMGQHVLDLTGLAAGIYYYEALSVSGQTETGRLVLLP